MDEGARACVALLAVIGQGVLGGYRVRLNSTTLAAVHGCTGQAFFALMVALCVLTGRGWSTAAGDPWPTSERLRRRSAVTLALIYAAGRGRGLAPALRHGDRPGRARRAGGGRLGARGGPGLAGRAAEARGPRARPRRPGRWRWRSRSRCSWGSPPGGSSGRSTACRGRDDPAGPGPHRPPGQRGPAAGLGGGPDAASVPAPRPRRPRAGGRPTAAPRPGRRSREDVGLASINPSWPSPVPRSALAAAGGKLASYRRADQAPDRRHGPDDGGRRLPARRPGSSDPSTLLLTLLGTGLVAGGASAWNQYLERSRDALMRRTAGRPLPSGRARPGRGRRLRRRPSACSASSILAARRQPGRRGGGGDDLRALRLRLHAAEAPDDPEHGHRRDPRGPCRRSSAGPRPPGGSASRPGRLFLIVFLWQFPHFLAIAWIYRDDYARAGHRMLPNVDPRGAMTGRQAAGLRPGPDPGRAPAGDDRPGRARTTSPGRWPWGCSTSPPPSGSGPTSPRRRPAGSCGRRSSTCPRSWCSCS